jgi:enterochelin esterase-like enzyme
VVDFSIYSQEEKFNNLYLSEEIFDEELKDSNKILVRIPNLQKPISDVMVSFDGQNLFDKETSQFGFYFNLENLIKSFEEKQDKNILIIAITSNEKRQTQYNPYPRGNSKVCFKHLKKIHSEFIPAVIENFNLNTTNAKRHVLGASMGGLMALKFSIINPEFTNVICLSPAFWYGFPGILKDIPNIEKIPLFISTQVRKRDIFLATKYVIFFQVSGNLTFQQMTIFIFQELMQLN